MAKKRSGGTSLSQHIRDHLADKSDATPNEIIEALGKKGVKVSPGLASNVKYTSGPKAKGKKRRGRKKGAQQTVRKLKPDAQTVDIAALQAAAKLLAEVGDANTAIAAIKQVQALQIG